MTTPVPKDRPTLSTNMPCFAVGSDGTPVWEQLLRAAVLLDEAGFDRAVVSDHVVFGEHLEEYARPEIGGQKGGQQPTGPDGAWLEPLAALTAVAARTSRMRLGTGILIAALRRPVILAKSLATMDVISGGRLDIGVGVGWQREEYEAAGLDFEGRGRLLDHSLEVCQALWRQTPAAYDSPELHFEKIHMMPKPVQAGGVPIWVSGTVNPRVARRLARFGSGWIPWGDEQHDVPAGIVAMRAAVEKAGGDPSGLQVTAGLKIERTADGAIDAEGTMAAVPALVDAGVTDLRARIGVPDDDGEAQDTLGALVAAFRTAAGRAD